MASDAADGGGGRKGWKKKLALWMPFQISVCLCSLSPRVSLSSLLDFTYFFSLLTGAHSLFPFFSLLLQVVNFFFLSLPLSTLVPPFLSTGATVLLVNATDLDASREFGQASLIYSLEGSSQFRLNSRSGVCARLPLRVWMYLLKLYMWWHLMSSNHQAFRIGAWLRSCFFFFVSLTHF